MALSSQTRILPRFRSFVLLTCCALLLCFVAEPGFTTSAGLAPGKYSAAGEYSAPGKYNRVLSLGSKGPKWSDLAGTDGKSHDFSDFAKSKALVVFFTCNACPVARAYEQRIVKFYKDYKAKGAAIVGINVNPESLDDMKSRAKEAGFTFPYVKDESQKSAKAYGARATPSFFVLDEKRRVVYMGAFDDHDNPSKTKVHWLRDAVDAVLAGKKPTVAETRSIGCGIKWKRD